MLHQFFPTYTRLGGIARTKGVSFVYSVPLFWKRRGRLIVWLACAVLLWYLACIVGQVSFYLPAPWSLLRALSIFMIGSFIVAIALFQSWVVLLPLLVIGAALKKNAVIPLVCFAIGSLIFAPLAAYRIAEPVKYWRARLVAKDARPLIDAIQQFHARTGDYPNELSDLVPTFLTAVPATGVPDRPFHYLRVDSPNSYLNAPWQLRVEIPGGFMDLDAVFYWPGQAYTWGDTIMVPGWSYHHD